MPPPLAALFACQTLDDREAQQACYMDAAGALRSAYQRGELIVVERERIETVERESFGFTLPSLNSLGSTANGNRPPIDQINASIVRVLARAHDRHAFELSNGQVWIQVEAQRTSNVRVGDVVEIQRGQVGNFLLVSSRRGAAHRVRRER